MNNNLKSSLEARCYCGRYITLGEVKAGLHHMFYECPDCISHRYFKPLTREEYYKRFNINLNN